MLLLQHRQVNFLLLFRKKRLQYTRIRRSLSRKRFSFELSRSSARLYQRVFSAIFLSGLCVAITPCFRADGKRQSWLDATVPSVPCRWMAEKTKAMTLHRRRAFDGSGKRSPSARRRLRLDFYFLLKIRTTIGDLLQNSILTPNPGTEGFRLFRTTKGSPINNR